MTGGRSQAAKASGFEPDIAGSSPAVPANSDGDAFDNAVEAYGDGIVLCIKCGVSGRAEEFESCAWGGCPMFGEG